MEGDVVEIADFGAFLRIGPVDALLHVSQLMDDYISYDEKQGVLQGKETKRKVASGDQVRVRITAVSLGRAGSSGKIGVTARQPFLGKLEWIKEDVAAIKGTVEKKAAEGKGSGAEGAVEEVRRESLHELSFHNERERLPKMQVHVVQR